MIRERAEEPFFLFGCWKEQDDEVAVQTCLSPEQNVRREGTGLVDADLDIDDQPDIQPFSCVILNAAHGPTLPEMGSHHFVL